MGRGGYGGGARWGLDQGVGVPTANSEENRFPFKTRDGLDETMARKELPEARIFSGQLTDPLAAHRSLWWM